MIKHIARYIVGGFLNRVLGLIALPIYTYFLSPEQYGTYAIILSYVSLGSLIFTLNTHSSVSRFLYEEDLKKEVFLSTSIYISLLLIALSFLIIYSIDTAFLSDLLEIDIGSYREIIFLLIFFGIMFGIYTQVLIPERKSKEYTRVTVIKSYSIFFISIVFLFLNRDVSSLIYSNLVVELVSFFYVAKFLCKRITPSVSFDSIKYIFSYSVFLLPYSLSGIILSQIDRVMLAKLLSLESVGIYSVGYTLSMIPWTVFVIFSKGWTPEYFSYMNNRKYNLLDRDTKYILWGAYFIILSMILFLGDIIHIVFGDKYSAIYDILPILLSSVVFMILWQLWGRGIGYSKKTIWTSIIGIVSAVVNVILNYFLIPLFGVKGAAYATLFSYIIMALLGYCISLYYLKIYTVGLAKLKVFFMVFVLSSLLCFILYNNVIFMTTIKAIYFILVISIVFRYREFFSKKTKLILGDR